MKRKLYLRDCFNLDRPESLRYVLRTTQDMVFAYLSAIALAIFGSKVLTRNYPTPIVLSVFALAKMYRRRRGEIDSRKQEQNLLSSLYPFDTFPRFSTKNSETLREIGTGSVIALTILLLLCSLSLHAAWFGYDRGVAAARQGDLDAAQELLTEELTARPDNVELLYDAGVAAYKKNDYVTAHAYFSKVVGRTSSEQPLHRQALFNLGDAYAGDKKLHEALQAFEQLLKLEPKNEHAQHNRDVIKKMLEQKQNEDSKKSDDKNEQKKDQQQDKKDSGQNKSDQKKSDQQKQDGKKDSSQGDQGSQGEQGKKGEQGDQGSQGKKGDQNKKQQQEQGGEGQAPDERQDYKDRYGDNTSGGQEEKDDAKKAGDKAGEKKDRGKQQDNAKQDNATHDNAAQETAELHKQHGQKGQKPMHAAWVDKVLDAVQKNDEALNKMLVHRAVAGNLGGRDGERCW